MTITRQKDGTISCDSIQGYETLFEVLFEAYNQASAGKGHERHAYGEPFPEQDICTEARTLGLAAPAFQARKKVKEALRLFEMYGAEEAIPDLLGAINYIAAMVIVMRRHRDQEADIETSKPGKTNPDR